MLCFNNSHEFHQTVLFHRRRDRELRGGKHFGGELARDPARSGWVGARVARQSNRYRSVVPERAARRLGHV